MATLTEIEVPKATLSKGVSKTSLHHLSHTGSVELLPISPTIDIESPPQTPANDTSTATHEASAMTAEMRQTEKIQFVSLCYCLFLAGWNDGTTGPLLPRIQSVYHIGFAVVSLLFIMNCIGFVAGACLNVYMTDRWGFGKVIVIGSIAQVIGYALDAPGPPFPVLCLGYVFNGFGIALQDAQANGYVASLKNNAATKMGLLHAAYGLGAMGAPLVATHFAQVPSWSFHFLTSLGIALTNTLVLLAVFRGKNQEECMRKIGQANTETGTSTDSKYRQIMSQKVLHLLAFFSLVYVGVEVTTGGWTVTYIIHQRGGGPSSGYVSTGFFGGLTFGRVALLWVNAKLGERLVIFIYASLAIALLVTVWVVHSLVGNAVAVSIVGVLLGPMYPIMMNQSALLIPPWLLTGSIGWIAGFGQAGSALLPFMTGALASKFGIKALEPFLVVLMCIMIGLWALVPKPQRRAD